MFEGWQYNLLAMMHGRSVAEIQGVVNELVEGEKTESFELLPTTVELKKQPIRYGFRES
jgi:hypothetical protein